MINVWAVDESEYPAEGTDDQKIRFWLRYAILAPSAHNMQPWKYEINNGSVTLFRDPEFTLEDGDASMRETFLGLGAFLENLVVAAAHFGYLSSVTDVITTTQSLEIATVKFEKVDDAEAHPDLFNGILKRHTNRGFYSEAPVGNELLSLLNDMTEGDAKLFVITDQDAKSRIAQLVGKGTGMALALNTMKRELAQLVWPESQPRDFGMMAESLVEDAGNIVDGKEFIENQMDADVQGKYWRDTFATSPCLLVIGTEFDGPESWLNAGRLLERSLLLSASYGLCHCISAAAVEVPILTPELRKEIDGQYRPQALTRIGIPRNPDFTKFSTRRPVK